MPTSAFPATPQAQDNNTSFRQLIMSCRDEEMRLAAGMAAMAPGGGPRGLLLLSHPGAQRIVVFVVSNSVSGGGRGRGGGAGRRRREEAEGGGGGRRGRQLSPGCGAVRCGAAGWAGRRARAMALVCNSCE